MKTKSKGIILLLLLSAIVLPVAEAHSGRTNSEGCHNNRKTGGYHCHNSGSGSSNKGSNKKNSKSGGNKRNEVSYSSAWCRSNGGSEPTLADGTRPDCELENIVVEFDWGQGMKPYECVGQALHYSAMTGKSPLCILIRKEGQSIGNFARYGRRAATSGAVAVQCMSPAGNMENCPF